MRDTTRLDRCGLLGERGGPPDDGGNHDHRADERGPGPHECCGQRHQDVALDDGAAEHDSGDGGAYAHGETQHACGDATATDAARCFLVGGGQGAEFPGEPRCAPGGGAGGQRNLTDVIWPGVFNKCGIRVLVGESGLGAEVTKAGGSAGSAA